MTPAERDELLAAIRDLTASVDELRQTVAHEQLEAVTAENAAALAQLSVSQFRELVRLGDAPPAREFGERCPRWLRAELMEWIRSRPVRQPGARAVGKAA